MKLVWTFGFDESHLPFPCFVNRKSLLNTLALCPDIILLPAFHIYEWHATARLYTYLILGFENGWVFYCSISYSLQAVRLGVKTSVLPWYSINGPTAPLPRSESSVRAIKINRLIADDLVRSYDKMSYPLVHKSSWKTRPILRSCQLKYFAGCDFTQHNIFRFIKRVIEAFSCHFATPVYFLMNRITWSK